jgi:hypothetical protein
MASAVTSLWQVVNAIGKLLWAPVWYAIVWIRFRRRGVLRHRLLQMSFLSLLVLFGSLYAILGLVFANVYSRWFPTEIKSTANDASGFDFWHFSFVTQATVGYGDFTPHGWARAVAAIQAFCGIALSSMFLGIVVFRLLRRESGIVATRNIYFSPQKKRFRWRIYNRDAEDVVNGNLCLRLLTYDEAEFVSGVAQEVELAHTGPTAKSVGIFPHGLVWAAETVSISAAPSISPGVLSDKNVLSLLFTGEALGAGSTVYAEWRYELNDIICGELLDIERSNPKHTVRELPRDWKAPRYALAKFDSYNETSAEFCRGKCEFRTTCQLGLARRLGAAT